MPALIRANAMRWQRGRALLCSGSPDGSTQRCEEKPRMRYPSSFARLGMALAALLTALVAIPTAASAQSNPFQRGPDPTLQSIQVTRGSFSVATENVSGFLLGFG